jgi:glycosyltransferase involved in cell wall biosynthesis
VDPSFGGVAVSVPQLCRATEAASESHDSPMLAFCEAGEIEKLPPDVLSLVHCFPPDRVRWIVDARLRRRLKHLIRSCQGVHIHGIWEVHCGVAASIARSCKRPYIISAHGMLDDWALSHKRLKKALYAALLETNNLQRSSCLRALTRDEIDNYRRVGLTGPVAVVPSGVDAPSGVSADGFWQTHPDLVGKRIVLFLGRLHQKKGLNLLLQAWGRVGSHADNAHLVIAGPDPENMLDSLKQTIDELKLRPCVTLTGMLRAENKWTTLAAASLFVLPSYSEGFSIAVLEALAMGVPVITTRACHFPEVVERDCGWVIEPNVSALQQALLAFFCLPSDEARRMGERGRHLIEERFTWSVVGRQMTEVYEWLLGGSRPHSVEVA